MVCSHGISGRLRRGNHWILDPAGVYDEHEREHDDEGAEGRADTLLVLADELRRLRHKPLLVLEFEVGHADVAIGRLLLSSLAVGRWEWRTLLWETCYCMLYIGGQRRRGDRAMHRKRAGDCCYPHTE